VGPRIDATIPNLIAIFPELPEAPVLQIRTERPIPTRFETRRISTFPHHQPRSDHPCICPN
jgi:hypothetical protein